MKVVLTAEAARQFAELPVIVKGRMLGLFERLRGWPAVSGVKALRGVLSGRYRMRTGDYRIRLRVEGDRVVVEKVGHRDSFYQG